MSTNQFSWFHRSLLRAAGQAKRWGSASPSTGEEGLTLIECLAAIVVVGLIGAAIAPVLVLSVATRVQSQKSEQALKVAQSEIDAIRVLLERGGDDLTGANFPPVAAGFADDAVTTALGPDAVTNDPDNYDADYTRARPLDIDDDGTFDFAIQSYRTAGEEIDSLPVAFTLGVRVYDYRAVEAARGNLDTRQASIGLTSSEGDRALQPLATLYTAMSVSDDDQSFCNYIDYLDYEETKDKPLGCN